MTTQDPWGPITGDLDDAKDAAARLAASIEQFGASETRRARSASTSWRWWAGHLADLAAQTPQPVAPPRWMNECGEMRETEPGAGHVDPEQLRRQLNRVIADADALAAALLRAADTVEQRQRQALDIVRSIVQTDAEERVP